MKYWISKYALSNGIFETEIEDEHAELIIALSCGKKHCHETEAAARSAAEEMRTKKIASLRKQIERLERMGFNDQH